MCFVRYLIEIYGVKVLFSYLRSSYLFIVLKLLHLEVKSCGQIYMYT